MQVKSEIGKFINEYNHKIKDCDTLLSSISAKIISAHRAKEDYDHLRKEEAIVRAQRQCHVQTIADFDALLDCEELVDKVE